MLKESINSENEGVFVKYVNVSFIKTVTFFVNQELEKNHKISGFFFGGEGVSYLF